MKSKSCMEDLMDFITPIEEPRSKYFGKNYLAVYSRKLDRVVHFFSILEYYNFLTLEMNPEVISFCEKPKQIEVIIDGKMKTVTFDMWVKYNNDTEEMQEIMYAQSKDKNNTRLPEQIIRKQNWCLESNISFRIITEKELMSSQILITNLARLAAKNRRYMPTGTEQYFNLMCKELKRFKTRTIKELITKQLLPPHQEYDFLAYLYYKGIIFMNLDKRLLDYNTEVWL